MILGWDLKKKERLQLHYLGLSLATLFLIPSAHLLVPRITFPLTGPALCTPTRWQCEA